MHIPPASAQAIPPQSLAPATPPKPASSGSAAGNSPALAAGQVGGCQPVDERQRVSGCALEVSPTCLYLHPVDLGSPLGSSNVLGRLASYIGMNVYNMACDKLNQTWLSPHHV